MSSYRLGDDIDDFCVRCKRLTNHLVVSVLNDEPAKVRCRTCHNDHDYRHEQAPPPKVDLRKQALFNEVLKKVSPDAPDIAPGAEAEIAPEPEVEPQVEPQAEPEEAAKPKARAKARK
jgi:hypothetical protein